jgi:hypothetical protein
MFDPNSLLEPAKRDENGVYFIDRNPDTFEVILEYLRTRMFFESAGNASDSKKVRAEAEFFGIGSLLQTKAAVNKGRNSPNIVDQDFYQVRQGRTWSRSYKSPSPPPSPSPPTRFRILVFLHFINFAIFLTTVLTTF